jgi:hypothetical protein
MLGGATEVQWCSNQSLCHVAVNEMRGARPFSDRYWRGRRLASLVAVPVYILLARKFDTRRLMMFGLASFGLRDVDLQLHYPRVGGSGCAQLI